MATTEKWVALTSRGNQLTTELNSLASAAISASSAAFDNTGNLDVWARLDAVLASLNPAAGSYLQFFMLVSLDGTNYEDAASSTNPGYHLASIPPVSLTTGSATKRVHTPEFWIPPCRVRFQLLNGATVSLAASGNTAGLYTYNRQSV